MGSISVRGLGKAYKAYPNHFARLVEWLVPFSPRRHQLKWILRNISFDVRQGEAVGIIGVNGAGKSTLLKMITGTTLPSEGEVLISGSVAAMLELGMGFHPDFTGRQNVLMAGQLLGMSNAEIEQLMPQIEAFAEIGGYIDQPMRVYSSGMQMRLAFSVATARRPDILIVDEALSVGDAYFQHRSFDRIRAFRQQGTTLLLVSHDKGAIQSICDRAILLHQGQLALEGDPETVMDYYNALLSDHDATTVRHEMTAQGRVQTVSGTGQARILAVGLTDTDGMPIERVEVGQAVRLQVTARTAEPIPELVFGFQIKDRLGQPVFGINTHHMKQALTNVAADQTIVYTFDFRMNLGVGNYSMAVALHSSNSHLQDNYQWKDLAIVFQVINTSAPEFVGTCWLNPSLACEIISSQNQMLREHTPVADTTQNNPQDAV